MSRLVKWTTVAALLALPLLSIEAQSSAQPAADIEVSQVDWETIGPNVRFHVQFHNPDQSATSGPVTGGMSSQPFGAFVPNSGPIGTFEVPALAPDSFFDVFFDVALSSLPPSAATILPGGGPGGGAGGTAPGITSLADVCPPPTFWNGNVDIFWTPPGTGSVNYHFGQLLICPGAGNSYVHVIMDCQDPAGISWSMNGLCPGWTATLVSDNGSFAPGAARSEPHPSGFLRRLDLHLGRPHGRHGRHLQSFPEPHLRERARHDQRVGGGMRLERCSGRVHYLGQGEEPLRPSG